MIGQESCAINSSEMQSAVARKQTINKAKVSKHDLTKGRGRRVVVVSDQIKVRLREKILGDKLRGPVEDFPALQSFDELAKDSPLIWGDDPLLSPKTNSVFSGSFLDDGFILNNQPVFLDLE